MKTIKFSLDTASINKAQKEIQNYKKELKNKTNQLLIALTDWGVEIAKVQIAEMNAVETSELLGSIGGYFSPNVGAGFIYAGAPYAIFVEMGVGIKGAQAPHPEPLAGWIYDSNNHGESGWWYTDPKDGRSRWTRGVKSRPFLWNTARELERICEGVAKEVFSR